MTQKRPASVTYLIWMVLIVTAWNAIRLGASISNWDLLAEFAPRPSPIYIAASASFWTLGGLALWIAIRRRNPRTRLLATGYIFSYAAWYWLDRLLLQEPRPSWPFTMVATILILALTVFIAFHRTTIDYFSQRETHDQTHTDPNSA